MWCTDEASARLNDERTCIIARTKFAECLISPIKAWRTNAIFATRTIDQSCSLLRHASLLFVIFYVRLYIYPLNC